jgi:transposase
VAHLKVDQLSEMDRERLRDLTREELEELTWQLVEVARSLADKVQQNSTNSSRPPSSDDPYRRRDQRQQARNDKANSQGDTGGDGAGSPPSVTSNSGTTDKKPSKPSGKRPGMPGFWRRQPMVVSRTVDHDAAVCAACTAPLGPAQRSRQSLPLRRRGTVRTTSTISNARPWRCGSALPNIAISPAAARAAMKP